MSHAPYAYQPLRLSIGVCRCYERVFGHANTENTDMGYLTPIELMLIDRYLAAGQMNLIALILEHAWR